MTFYPHHLHILEESRCVRKKNHVEILVRTSWMIGLCILPSLAIPADPAPQTSTTAASNNKEEPHFFVRQYRVEGGGHLLSKSEIEEAVYPYLGPYRTTDDVEKARAALEKTFRDKGYQTVTVQIPQQQIGEIIRLQVMKGEVERLQIMGSRYYSLQEIRREAPSLQEGVTPNFNQVSRDMVTLNQNPDRQITPKLLPGKAPGTVDVELDVKDTPPWHGSLEINNRYSADTTPLRLNGSVGYTNLWQLGHSVGASFQLSPENPEDVKVFSGYYLAHVPDVDGLSLMLQGTDQNSNVSTLGGIGVAGRGDTMGIRAIFSFPPQKNFYHSVSLGIDYKHYEQTLVTAGQNADTPVTYFPLSAAYNGTWLGKGYETDLDASANFGLREIGSSQAEYDLNRHGASGGFVYFRGDLAHTHDLPGDFQIYGKAQGQASDEPLVNSEQFSGGGLGSVRGYLESEELGDNALLGSVEVRTPSLDSLFGKSVNEWRFYLFSEGGALALNEALPEQQSLYTLASVGAGTRFKVKDHFNGSLDLGVPLIDATQTKAYGMQLTFRVWADF